MYYDIQLGGRERRLRFNFDTLDAFVEKVFAEKNAAIKSIYIICWGALISASKAKSEEIDYTFEDVIDWVDNLYNEGKGDELLKVDEIWLNTKVYKDWFENFNKILADFNAKQIDSVQPEETKKNKPKISKVAQNGIL